MFNYLQNRILVPTKCRFSTGHEVVSKTSQDKLSDASAMSIVQPKQSLGSEHNTFSCLGGPSLMSISRCPPSRSQGLEGYWGREWSRGHMLALSSLPPFVLTHPTTEDKHGSRRQSQAASALISNGLVAMGWQWLALQSVTQGFPRWVVSPSQASRSVFYWVVTDCHLPSVLFLSLSNSMTHIIYDSQNLGSKRETKMDYSLSLRFIRKVIYKRES